MKKMTVFAAVLLLCLSLACPVFAAETFVPSISYKDLPVVQWPVELVDADGEPIQELDQGCLVITPVSEAETSAEIPADAKELLLEVYQKLSDGSMTLPGDEDLIIRDLFDASLICDDDHREQLAQEGACIELTFDLDIPAREDVVIMYYLDGTWYPAESVVNNGDGTVTCSLENLCPIAIAVSEEIYDVPAQTGDASGILFWTAVMLTSAAAMVLLVIRRKAAC